jgi:DNA-binding IscR family transcriptional regulator
MEPALTTLSRAGIIITAGGDNAAGWVPARPPEGVTLAELLSVLRADAAGGEDTLAPQRASDAAIETAEQAAAAALAGRSLADLADEATAAPPSADVHRLPTGREKEKE